MVYQKTQNIRKDRQDANTRAEVEKQAALLEYVAEMADVELPEDETESEGGSDE